MPRRRRVKRTSKVYIDIADPVPRSPPKVKSEVVGVGEPLSPRPTGTLRSPQRSPWIPLFPSQLGLQGLPGATLSPTQSQSPRAPPRSPRKPLPQSQSGSPPESPYSLRASHPVTLIPVDSGEVSPLLYICLIKSKWNWKLFFFRHLILRLPNLIKIRSVDPLP